MRFGIDFDKGDRRRQEIWALEVFLNEHLIERFHGPGLTSIFLDLVENPKKAQKFRKRLLYGEYAQIELPFEFSENASDNFLRAFDAVRVAVTLAGEIPLKTPGFEQEALQGELAQLRSRQPRGEAALKRYLETCGEVERQNQARRARMLHRVRQSNPRPLKTALKGVRIFAHGECANLELRAREFAETYGNLLRTAGVRTPRYSEIYIHVAPSIEEAIAPIALETWHQTTGATLDPVAFEKAAPGARHWLLAETYADALRSIARIDHLDLALIEPVLTDVLEKGLDRDLVALEKQTKNYSARVLYNVTQADNKGIVPYRLRLTCLNTGARGEKSIADLDLWYAPYSLNGISFSKSEVVIKARKSFRAEITLKHLRLPSEFRFGIEDVLRSGRLSRDPGGRRVDEQTA